MVEGIAQLPSRRARAQALLQLPDAVLLANAEGFRAAFAGDEDLSVYLDVRLGALHARREPDGLWPDAMIRQMAGWRQALVKFAAGGP